MANNIFDLLFMLMNLQQMYLNQSPPQNPNPLPQMNPYADLEAMPNVHVIRGTPKPRDVSTVSPLLNVIRETESPPLDLSKTFLQEVKMNKCCPLNFHYAEDKYGRMKCKQHDSEYGRIVSKSKVFKTVKQYACEASMGQYIDDFAQLDLNGDGFVKYKNEIYEKSCMDYDARKGKFIIIKCKAASKKVDSDEVPRDSRVLSILKKRAEKLNEIEKPVRTPQLKNRPTRPTVRSTAQSTTTVATAERLPPSTIATSEESSLEYSYEEVEVSEEHIPETKSRSETKVTEAKSTKSEEYEYEYEEIE